MRRNVLNTTTTSRASPLAPTTRRDCVVTASHACHVISLRARAWPSGGERCSALHSSGQAWRDARFLFFCCRFWQVRDGGFRVTTGCADDETHVVIQLLRGFAYSPKRCALQGRDTRVMMTRHDTTRDETTRDETRRDETRRETTPSKAGHRAKKLRTSCASSFWRTQAHKASTALCSAVLALVGTDTKASQMTWPVPWAPADGYMSMPTGCPAAKKQNR